MTLPLPASISTEDVDELKRLLLAVFKGDEANAAKWLTERSGVFNCPPVDLLRRDEIGVVRVIDYLRDAVPA